MDELSEKFQTAFEIILRFSRQNYEKSAYIYHGGNVLYYPISHEMHVVQQFNMVIGWKTYPEKTPLYHFLAEKTCLTVQILQYKFLDWKWPPLQNFS